ncbi:AraC family transcriptional regulator [Bosea lathyri]|uniref:Transcriptional regulator, AraC family n=1 Tax=Bosea lathyri TaxID=1036778 RepID=A0A1H6CYG3_9HYPH|nr:AraC family transcriptional regulator [Bosea lathyri]SEG78110.1 transcriptional regulator, AraC family [Bosea lathyri]
MTFQPRMTSLREGVTVIGALKWRAFNGVVADLWHAECGTGARGEYVSEHPRLFIVLDKIGGEFETRLRPDMPGPTSHERDGSITYMPAGVPIWGRTRQRMQIRHLDLHFDPAEVSERLSERFDASLLAEPKIMFSNERILALARLIAAECAEPDARHDLYGDGLTLAVLIDLFQIGRKQPRKRSPLTTWQLRRVTDYMSAHCDDNIRLQDLAALVDLSQSHFSHAFKASTGVPPHQWQLQARVRRGQEMLVAGDRTLTEIAVEAGFSDQAHFTRVFRRVVGETPAAWQRSQRA